MKEKPKILIVDDEPSSIFLFTGILEKEGYRVVSASSGEEALNLIKTDPPGLILSDLLMPRLHGFNLLQELKYNENFKHIPVIIATAVYKGALHRMEVKRQGAEEFLEKPVDPDLLVETVKRVLAPKPLDEEDY
jgi:CheY-like chemotaxis protein